MRSGRPALLSLFEAVMPMLAPHTKNCTHWRADACRPGKARFQPTFAEFPLEVCNSSTVPVRVASSSKQINKEICKLTRCTMKLCGFSPACFTDIRCEPAPSSSLYAPCLQAASPPAFSPFWRPFIESWGSINIQRRSRYSYERCKKSGHPMSGETRIPWYQQLKLQTRNLILLCIHGFLSYYK